MLHTSYLQSGEHSDLSQQFIEDMADVTISFRKLVDVERKEMDAMKK
jgi:hypothetical protein